MYIRSFDHGSHEGSMRLSWGTWECIHVNIIRCAGIERERECLILLTLTVSTIRRTNYILSFYLSIYLSMHSFPCSFCFLSQVSRASGRIWNSKCSGSGAAADEALPSPETDSETSAPYPFWAFWQAIRARILSRNTLGIGSCYVP